MEEYLVVRPSEWYSQIVREAAVEPLWLKQRIPYARLQHQIAGRSTICSQTYKGLHHVIGYYEGRLHRNLEITVQLGKQMLLGVIVLEGVMRLPGNEPRRPKLARSKQCFLASRPPGTCRIQLDKGPVRLLLFAQEKAWVTKWEHRFTHIRPLLLPLLQGRDESLLLPLQKLNSGISRPLKQLLKLKPDEHTNLELAQLQLMEEMLKGYDLQMAKGNVTLRETYVQLVERFELAVYAGLLAGAPENIAQLIDRLGTSDDTLRRACHEVHREAPKQVQLTFSFGWAQSQLRAGAAPMEVASKMGYAEYTNFSRQYKKRFKRLPSKDKGN
ncbi:Helix-turn-helix domain-containing protein [bacterium A37T11]|nr:Helix-turn-helix domain-containing protein [bacterium A37T11]